MNAHHLDQATRQRIEQLIASHRVFLFMKGTPRQPMCGFSAAVVEVLTGAGTEFGSFDVLSDIDIRQGIKAYASWPTIPQLYVDGEFVGGCDIVRELHASGDLQAMLS